MRHLPVEGRFTAAFQSWRDSALRAISAGWPGDTIQWFHEPLNSGTQGLFDYAGRNEDIGEDVSETASVDDTVSHQANACAAVPGGADDLTVLRDHSPAPLRVSKELASLLSDAALYRDAQRWSFLYHLLWRWAHGDRTCASAADADGAKLHRMAKAVRRDKHDMIAYVRFRQPGDTADANQAHEANQARQAHQARHMDGTHQTDESDQGHQAHQLHQLHRSQNKPDYIAEYSPEHDVLEWAADHFAQRMGKSTWVISTPDAFAMSDGSALSIITRSNALLPSRQANGNAANHTPDEPDHMPDSTRANAPATPATPVKIVPEGMPAIAPAIAPDGTVAAHANARDDMIVAAPTIPAPNVVHQVSASDVPPDAESLWLIYYRSTFNPARVDKRGLEQRMPVRHWRGLPEAALIPGMLSAAQNGQRELAQARQIGAMPGKSVLVDARQAQPRRDPSSTLDKCRRCELWRTATQVVPGCGPKNARIMLIGEQPGDQEDLAGRPFVGPAGKLLDSAMHEAGLSRDSVYMTNAVKHFKWTPKGKRRIHKTPQQREIEACREWLEDELATVQPVVIVALGASALNSLNRSISRSPGMLGNSTLLATRHPAYALRQSDPDARIAIFNEIADTLRTAVRHCEALD